MNNALKRMRLASALSMRVSSVAMAAALAAGPALAQTAPPAQPDAPQAADQGAVQEIIVTGLRRSLEQAAEIKRDAPQIMDVITATDIGKLPDANVAEALQRVTGVQITRVFGEGQAVSVRGLQQVRVEVDGRTLLGWSARLSPPENDQLGRSSGLDSVPSGLFGKLAVYKTPLASQAEGGLGGTVNLVTPKPLSFKKPTFSFQAQGTYSENSEKTEPAVSGFGTTTFANGRIGVMLAGEYQKRTSTNQTVERNNFLNRTYTSGGVSSVTPTPALLQYESFVVDRSRAGLNGAVQFEVTPEFTVTADALYSRLTTGRKQDFFAFRLPTTANPVTNAVIENGMVVAGDTRGTVTTAGQLRNEPTESFLYGLNAKYEADGLTVVADGYYSKGTIDQTIQIITLQANGTIPGSFDFRNRTVPALTLAGTFDPANYAAYAPATNAVRSNRLIGLLEEWTGKLDASKELAGGFTLSAGARYTDLNARSNAYRSQVTPTRAEIEPYLRTVDGFLPDISGNFPRRFLSTAPTRDYVFTRAQAAQPNPNPNDQSTLLPNSQRDYDLTESVLAGYVMVAHQGMVGSIPYKANVGVRVARTNLSVDTFLNVGTTSTLVNDKNDYTNLLPSANVTFNVTDDFLVRLSASQTMQRASIADLAPSVFFNATNLSVTGGNADLKPPVSTQGDVSFEYYMGESSLLSGAVFYKDVKDFIATFVTTGVDTGLDPQGRELVFSRPENLASAKIKGFEVGVQQFLDFLPEPFDGFGVIANYTYSDSEDKAGFPLVAVSKNSYNLIGLYEKGAFSARIAYNYRDEALFEFSEGRPSFIGARSQLDAQIGIDLTDQISMSLQAQNLLPKKSATVEYSGSSSTALNSYALSERRFTVGLRAKL